MLSSNDGLLQSLLAMLKKELKCRRFIEACQEHFRSPRFLDHSMSFIPNSRVGVWGGAESTGAADVTLHPARIIDLTCGGSAFAQSA
jgi:hypothetical protein